jgi:hypothetical protein
MTIAGTPTLSDLKSWLGLEADDTQDDIVLSDSLAAALENQCMVVNYPCDPFGDRVFNADLREAVFLRAQRLAARRNSPEGIVGLQSAQGDFAGARLPSGDPDVMRLEGSHLKMVVS